MSYSNDPISDKDLIDGLKVGYLKFYGIWGFINHYRTTGRRSTRFKIFFFITLVIELPPVIFDDFMAFYYIPMDIQKFTVTNSHVFPCLHILGRYILYWTQLDGMSMLFDLFKRDFLTTIPDSKRSEVSEMYREVSWALNHLVKFSMTCSFILMFVFVFNPGFPVDYIEYGSGKLDVKSRSRYKILGGWYPFPMSESPYYEYILIYEGISAMCNCLSAATFFCALFEPLICLTTHFRVLGYHISTMKVSEHDGSANSDIYKQLYNSIQDHRKLIRYANKLKEVYNPAITLTLGIAICMEVICFFEICFGGVDDPLYKLKYVMLTAFVISEVFVFCYAATLIQEASEELTLALYTSDWYMADQQYKKMARMIMTGANKGITLVAMKMYPVNVETMVNLYQFTFTVATLMSNMAE